MIQEINLILLLEQLKLTLLHSSTNKEPRLQIDEKRRMK